MEFQQLDFKMTPRTHYYTRDSIRTRDRRVACPLRRRCICQARRPVCARTEDSRRLPAHQFVNSAIFIEEHTEHGTHPPRSTDRFARMGMSKTISGLATKVSWYIADKMSYLCGREVVLHAVDLQNLRREIYHVLECYFMKYLYMERILIINDDSLCHTISS